MKDMMPTEIFKTQYWPYGNQGLGYAKSVLDYQPNMFNTDRDRYIISFVNEMEYNQWLNIIGRARIDNAYTDFERKLVCIYRWVIRKISRKFI